MRSKYGMSSSSCSTFTSLGGSNKVPFFLEDRVTKDTILSSVIHSSYLKKEFIEIVQKDWVCILQRGTLARQAIPTQRQNVILFLFGGGELTPWPFLPLPRWPICCNDSGKKQQILHYFQYFLA